MRVLGPFLAAVWLVQGCTGHILAPEPAAPAAEAEPDPGAPTVRPDLPPPPAADPEDRPSLAFPGDTAGLVPRRVWRLTSAQYRAAVESALGVPLAGDTVDLFDAADFEYSNHPHGLRMTLATVEAVEETAARVRAAILADECRNLDCTRAGLAPLLDRLHRGEAPAAARAAAEALFDRLVAEARTPRDAFVETAGWSVARLGVLFRTEAGASPEATVSLTPLETANALAYALWGTGPDDALQRAALAGDLETADGRTTQAQRLMADPRFVAHMGAFFAEWLGYDALEHTSKDVEAYPFFDRAYAARMRADVDGYVTRVFARGASFVELMSSQEGFQFAALPEAYAGDTIEGDRVTTRAGLALAPGVLAARSGASGTRPMTRAARLLERLFCVELPVPDDVDLSQVPDPSEVASERERFEALANVPACQGCHRLLNPVAFALERYDPAGRHRTEHEGAPIDPAGRLDLGLEPVGAFEDATILFERAARSLDVQRCFTRQLFAYTFGVEPGRDHEPWLRDAFRDFEAADYDMRALLLSWVRSDFFRLRGGDR